LTMQNAVPQEACASIATAQASAAASDEFLIFPASSANATRVRAQTLARRLRLSG
jgi:hypothetical protein